jgi:hypothetical protein
MSRIIKKLNKESLTTKLTLVIIGLTAGSGLLIPATYASFHPVTTGEIADNTILSVDIGNGQVRTEDIGAGQVRAGDIANDAIQPNIQIIKGSIVPLLPNGSNTATVDCPAGTLVTGGGYYTDINNVVVWRDYPVDVDTWSVVVYNPNSADYPLTPYALCMGPMP